MWAKIDFSFAYRKKVLKLLGKPFTILSKTHKFLQQLLPFTVLCLSHNHSFCIIFIVDVYKISDYEAVHTLRHWKALKHHVSSHCRCVIFTHHVMPCEPLMILHTAVATEPSSCVIIITIIAIKIILLLQQ